MRLIDADELVNNLVCLKQDLEDCGYDLRRIDGIQYCIEEIRCIKAIPQYGQWFKVEDKLPEKNKPVLVIVNGRDWDEPVQYLDIDSLTEDGLWNAHHLDVSYWMPLPEPPKENETVKSNALESN